MITLKVNCFNCPFCMSEDNKHFCNHPKINEGEYIKYNKGDFEMVTDMIEEQWKPCCLLQIHPVTIKCA